MYLSIPNDMMFKKITENGVARDYFIDPNGIIPNIDLQELLKDALRTNTHRPKEIDLKVFSIYLRTPPDTDEFFLKYTPNCNGKYATAETPILVRGSAVQKFKPETKTQYGTMWYQNMVLSDKRMEEIKNARIQQKENRRHYGDSPLAT